MKLTLPVPFNNYFANKKAQKYTTWVLVFKQNGIEHTINYQADYLHTAVHYLQFDLKIHPSDLISINPKK